MQIKTYDMDWKEKAVHLLNNSLSPVPTEHNELDWESGNSCIWDEEERFAGRFELYKTQNMYNFILLDTFDGRTWQVQWSTEAENRMILSIY